MGISGHAVEMLLIAQGRKIRYHIFDLFGAEHRLSLKCRRYANQTGNAVVRRHDGLRIETACVDDSESQLALRRARSGAGQVGRQGALKLFVRERPTVAEQAKPDLPVGYDRATAFRISLLPRSATPGWRPRRSHKVLARPRQPPIQSATRRLRIPLQRLAGRCTGAQPNTSPVMVLTSHWQTSLP